MEQIPQVDAEGAKPSSVTHDSVARSCSSVDLFTFVVCIFTEWMDLVSPAWWDHGKNLFFFLQIPPSSCTFQQKWCCDRLFIINPLPFCSLFGSVIYIMALWCTQTRRSLPTCVYPFQPESDFILNLKLLSSDYFIRSSVYAHTAQFRDFEAEERASAAAPHPPPAPWFKHTRWTILSLSGFLARGGEKVEGKVHVGELRRQTIMEQGGKLKAGDS